MRRRNWIWMAAALAAVAVAGGDAIAKKGGGGGPGGGIPDADVSVIYRGNNSWPYKGDNAANTERAFASVVSGPRFGPSSTTSLVYAAVSSDGPGIFTTSDFSGGGVTRVVGVTGSVSFTRPDWSEDVTPNGQEMIAFRDEDADGRHQVWVTSLDGSVVTQLTFDPPGEKSHNGPRWNPANNSQIVFGGLRGLWLMDVAVDGNNELYAASVQDLAAGTVLEGVGLYFCDFSPDGQRIYFNAQYPDPNIHDIWVYDMQTQTATNLTNQADGVNRWSACERNDGKVIFDADGGRKPSLWVMNQDGSGRTKYTSNPKQGQSDPACRR